MTGHVAVRRKVGIRARPGRAAAAIALALAVAGVAGAQDSVRKARVVGRVIDGGGIPIAHADVAVLPKLNFHAVTDDSGRFHLDSLPVGAVQIAVRRMGFESATFTAQLKAGPTQRMTIPLTALAAVALPEVDIKDTAPVHPWLAIFDRRRTVANSGTFFTREDIVKSGVRITTDLLRRVPGVRIVPLGVGTRVLFERGGGTPGGRRVGTGNSCEPQMFVHSMNYTGTVDDFAPDDVEAMEIYVGISQVPVELQTAKAHTCGAIVIWTREPPPAQKKVPGSGGDSAAGAR